MLSTERGSLFESQGKYIAEGAAEAGGKVKAVAKKFWMPTVRRLMAQGWLESARVQVRSEEKEPDTDDEEGGGGVGASAAAGPRTRGGAAMHKDRIFLGTRAIAELGPQLREKGVEDCIMCGEVCVSPDPTRLPDKRVHAACAAKTAQPYPVAADDDEGGGAALVAAGAKPAAAGGGKRKRA